MTQTEYKMIGFVLYPEDDERITRIAARMAEVLGLKNPNRSDALRRILADFDVEAWAARYAPTSKQAA